MKETDYCECSYCGIKVDWEGSDDIRGNIWTCDHCGEYFCTKCFEERFSKDIYREMFREGDEMLCPDCYMEKLLSDEERDALLAKLWGEFGNVPINPETERIEERWQRFSAGTHREEIWKWFDYYHRKGVVALMCLEGI